MQNEEKQNFDNTPKTVWLDKYQIPVYTDLKRADEILYATDTQLLKRPKTNYFALADLGETMEETAKKSLAERAGNALLGAGVNVLPGGYASMAAAKTTFGRGFLDASIESARKLAAGTLKDLGTAAVAFGQDIDSRLSSPAKDLSKMPTSIRWQEEFMQHYKAAFSMLGPVDINRVQARFGAWDREQAKIDEFNGKVKNLTDYVIKHAGLDKTEKDGLMYDFGAGAFSFLFSVGALAVTRNPALVAPLFGVMEGQGSYETAIEAGLDPVKAYGLGKANAAWITATEMVGEGLLNKLLFIKGVLGRAAQRILKRAKGKSPTAKITLAGAIGAAQGGGIEGAQETVQNIGSDVIMNLGGAQEKKVMDILQEALYAGLLAFPLGFGAGGAGGSYHYANSTKKIKGRLEQEFITGQKAETLAQETALESVAAELAGDGAGEHYDRYVKKMEQSLTQGGVDEKTAAKLAHKIALEEAAPSANLTDNTPAANYVRYAQNVKQRLLKAGLSEAAAQRLAHETALEAVSSELMDDTISAVSGEINSPLSAQDRNPQALAEAVKSTQTRDFTKEYDEIETRAKNKFKEAGLSDEEAALGAAVEKNIVKMQAAHLGLTPELAEKSLEISFNQELSESDAKIRFIGEMETMSAAEQKAFYKTSKMTSYKEMLGELAAFRAGLNEETAPILDSGSGGAQRAGMTTEEFAQAAAMYRNPAKSLAEFRTFAVQNKGNPTEDNKSFYRFTTKDGVDVEVPFERALHIDGEHHLTDEQLGIVEKYLTDPIYAAVLPHVGEYQGRQVKIKSNTPLGPMGAVLEVLPNGRVFLDTAFFDTDANIDNWAKGNPPNAPSNKPVFIGEGYGYSLADIIQKIKGQDGQTVTFAQGAMYKSPHKEFAKFYEAAQNNAGKKQSYYTFTTKDGVDIDIPSDTILHDKKHSEMTAEKWLDVLNHIDNIEAALAFKNKKGAKYKGQPVLLKINGTNTVFGVVAEVTDNGRVLITTAFESTGKKGVDAWLAEEERGAGTPDALIFNFRLTTDSSRRATTSSHPQEKNAKMSAPLRRGQAPGTGDVISGRSPIHSLADIIQKIKGKTYKQDVRGKMAITSKDGFIRAVITAGQAADKSTFVHEMAHIYLSAFQHVYGMEEYTAQRKHLDAWLGKPRGGVYSRAQQEKFAQGFEQFLKEGRAPVPYLKSIFEKFRAWIIRVYDGVDVSKLSDAAREAYADMFRSEAADAQHTVEFCQNAKKDYGRIRATLEKIKQNKIDVKDLDGVDVEALRDFIGILKKPAPALPKRHLLTDLRRYGAQYANSGRIDKEAYKNARVYDKQTGVGDKPADWLVKHGYMEDAEVNTYEEAQARDEEACGLIERALSGEPVYRLEDRARVELHNAYREAVNMAEDAIGADYKNYEKLLENMDALVKQGYRVVEKSDLAFMEEKFEELANLRESEAFLAQEESFGRVDDARRGSADERRKEKVQKARLENLRKAQSLKKAVLAELGKRRLFATPKTESGKTALMLDSGSTPGMTANGITAEGGKKFYYVSEIQSTEGLAHDQNTGSLGDIDSITQNSDIVKAQNPRSEVEAALAKIAAGSEEETVPGLRPDFVEYGGTPDVTFIWGNEKKGLQHIALEHGSEILPQVIDTAVSGDIVRFAAAKKTLTLQKGNIEAVLSLDENGKQKTWLLTGWDTTSEKGKKKRTGANGQVSTDTAATQTPPTFSRQDLGAVLSNSITQNSDIVKAQNPLAEVRQELEKAKTVEDIYKGIDHALAVIEDAYGNSEAGKAEAGRMAPPAQDWDARRVELLKELSEINQKTDDNAAWAFAAIERDGLIVPHKNGMTPEEWNVPAAVSEKQRKMNVWKAEQILDEQLRNRYYKAFEKALGKIEGLKAPQKSIILREFNNIRYRNKNAPELIVKTLESARQYVEKNYKAYMAGKIADMIKTPLFEKSGSLRTAKYSPAAQEFLKAAHRIVTLDEQTAQDSYAHAVQNQNYDEALTKAQVLQNRLLQLRAAPETMTAAEVQELYNDVNELRKAGRDEVRLEKFLRNTREDMMRGWLIDALAKQKTVLGAVTYVKKLANWQSILNTLFGELEVPAEVNGQMGKKKIKFMDELSLEQNQIQMQNHVRELRRRVVARFGEAYGIKNGNEYIKKINELQSETYTLDNYGEIPEGPQELLTERQRKPFKQTITKLELMFFYIQDQNPLNRARLQRAYREEQYASLFAPLSSADKKACAALMEIAQSTYGQMNEVHKRERGFTLGRVENYFPNRTERLTGGLDYLREMLANNAAPSAIKARVQTVLAVEKPVNPVSLLMGEISRNAEYIYGAESAGKLRRIFRDKQMARALEEKFGKQDGRDIYEHIIKMIDLNGPGARIAEKSQFFETMEFLFNNWVKSAIGLKPIVAVKQFASAFNYVENMPVAAWISGFKDALAHPQETLRFMQEFSPYLVTRYEEGGMNETLGRALSKDDTFGTADKINTLTNAITVNVRLGDKFALAFGGKPYVDWLMKEKGYTKEAARAAFELATVRSQQANLKSTLNEAQLNGGNLFWRAAWAFRNQQMQYARKLFDAYADWKNGYISDGDMAKKVFMYAIVQPALYTLLSLGWFAADDDDRKDDWWRLAASPVEQTLGAVPFGDDLTDLLFANLRSLCADGKLSGMRSYELPGIVDMTRSFNKFVKNFNAGDADLNDWLDTLAEIGQFSGFGTKQIKTQLGGVKDALTGKPIKGGMKIIGYTDNRAKKVTGEKERTRKNKK